ncbi:MAG: hypothetical protein KC503_24650 [Myxococcales bacterium]|nr:hypothetical protein [Myxococcales bacterium]
MLASRLVYDGLQLLALPLSLPLLAAHPRLRGGLAERLGAAPRCDDAPIWLHGSSAGDVAALLPLARRLHGSKVLSSFTRAGEQLARQRLAHGWDQPPRLFRLPIDWSPLCRRAIRRVAPRALILECLELWPALVGAAQRRDVPVVIVNGRLSERSLARYARLPSLFRPRFAALAQVNAIDGQHAERFARAGVPAERVAVVGSSKHGDMPSGGSFVSSRARVVFGSVHAEELSVLDALPGLFARWPALEVEVAPRYARDVAAARRRIDKLPLDAAQRQRVVLRDQMGGLAQAYGGAALAFVGGSIAPRGGHNVVEPASRGAHVVVGPHTEACANEVAALCRAGVLSRISDASELVAVADRVLATPAPARAESAVAAARALAGEADRLALRLGSVLEGRA